MKKWDKSLEIPNNFIYQGRKKMCKHCANNVCSDAISSEQQRKISKKEKMYFVHNLDCWYTIGW